MVMQVEFHHVGACKLKGMAQVQHLIQVTSAHLAARKYPDGIPNAGKKTKLLAAGQGFQYALHLT